MRWLAISIAGLCATASADDKKPHDQLLDRLLTRPWKGLSKQPLQEAKGGTVVLDQALELKPAPADKVTGNSRQTLTIDGKSYSARSTVSGVLRRGTDELALDFKLAGGDKLPSPLIWCATAHADLRFFTDKNKAGKYLLKGAMYYGGDGCVGVRADLEYAD